MDQELMEMLQGMSEEELAQLTQNFAGERGKFQDQQSLAKELRGTADPQGTMAGGQYVAANPWERLTSLGSRAIGAHLGKKSREGLEGVAGKEATLQGNILSQLIRGGGQQQQQAVDPQTQMMMNAYQNQSGSM